MSNITALQTCRRGRQSTALFLTETYFKSLMCKKDVKVT